MNVTTFNLPVQCTPQCLRVPGACICFSSAKDMDRKRDTAPGTSPRRKKCHILLTYRSFPVIWVLPFRSIDLNPQYVWFAYDSDVPFSFPFHAFVHPVMVKVTTTQWNSNVTVTVRFDSVLSCRPMGSFKLTSGQGKNLNFWGSKTYLSWTHP